MARLSCTHLLFVTMTYLLLGCSHTSHQTVKPVYISYGTKMCRYIDPLFFVAEDLSCNRIPAPTEKSIYKSENKQLSGVTSLTVLTQLGICNNTNIKRQSQLGLNQEATSSPDLQLFQNNRDITLYRACEKGRLALVKYILSYGIADVNCRGELGRTPVMAAVRTGQTSVFDFLVSRGCKLSAVDDNNENVLHLACEGGNVDVVEKLVVGEKINIKSQGKNGYTPVLKTVYNGHKKMFDFLVSKGCNLMVVNNYRNNVLHVACVGGDVDIVNCIVSMNIVDIESKNRYKRTPLMVAAYYGHKRVFDFLVSKGCNLKVLDKNRNNVLHLAGKGGDVDIVKYLITLPAVQGMEKAKNKQGRTPVQEAKRYRLASVSEF